MADLFPVNGDLEGAYMKQIKLFFALFILCLCPFGCDEGMIDPMQLVDIVSQYETTVQTEIPDEVLAAMKLKADEMSKWVRIQLTAPVTDERTFMRENGYDKIDFFYELQKAYYTKYIDAAGIAIVAPQHIRSKDLIDARDAIVVMTSKHPELRERILSKHGRYYMVLLPDYHDQIDMPENQLNSVLLNDDPSDDLRGIFGSCSSHYGFGTPYKYGLCWAVVNQATSSAKTFVHEFAHAIQSEMERLQPGFEDKLKEFYSTRGGSLPWYEYWARATEAWFYHILPPLDDNKYEEFIEEFGFVGESLDYWFPRVRLGNDERGFSLGERQADGAWVLVPDAEDILQDKIVQAHNILEKHCFECHGENGTHKDVLLINNEIDQTIWNLPIISPSNPDGSILFKRILGHPAYGPQMPLGKPPLSEEEIDIIEIWIDYFRGKVRFPSGNIIPF